MFGVLNLDKPAGVTSRDMVNRVQRLVRPAKVGHAGTLDPLATGVLVVCIGPATRLAQYVQRMHKQYRATFLLGMSSDTDDIQGQLAPQPDAPQPQRQQLEAAMSQLGGELAQVPPAYSAVKIRGRRAYALARRGQQADLRPRKVQLYHLELMQYEYPRLVLQLECGSGFYVRALGRDLAKSLGTCAVMSDLVRTRIGPFLLDDACAADQLTADNLASFLRPAQDAVADLPQVQLSEEKLQRVARGQSIAALRPLPLGSEIAAYDARGALVGILTANAQSWRPTKILTAHGR